MTRHPWCRRVLAAAAVLPVVAALVSSCGGSASRPSSAPVPTSPLAATKPRSNTLKLPSGVITQIPLKSLSGGPTGIVGAFGSIWVETHRDSAIYRIDPRKNQVVATVDIGQGGCGEPVAGFGRVWVGPCGDGSKTIGIDPRTNRVVSAISNSNGINVVTRGSLWTPNLPMTMLLRIDPTTLKVQARINAPGIDDVYDGRYIWAVDVDGNSGQFTGLVTEVDPATDQIIRRLHVPSAHITYGWAAYVAGYVWIDSASSAKVIRIDPSTGAVRVLQVSGFKGLTDYSELFPDVAMGDLWVRSASGVVERLNPRTLRVLHRYPADPQAGGGYPYVAFHSLWETNFSSGTVWRVRL